MDALTTAHAATDKALDAMEKHVRSIYLRSVREIYKSWQNFFEKESKRIEKLQEDYEKAKKSGDKTLIKETGIALAREKKKETIQNKRFHDAVKQTAENLLHVNEKAVEYLNGRLPETYVTNFNAVGELCEDAVTGYSYHIVDENTIRELAMSDTSLLPYKEIDPAKDIVWNVRQMKSEVLQGILQGEDMQTIAKRLLNVIGMNENSAVRNARTMVTAAENKGRQDGFYQAEEDGIILEKYWLSVHGERTREAHAAAGNDYAKSKSIPQSQPFIVGGEKLMFPGDNSMGASGWNLYNCRCSVAAVVKGFRKAQAKNLTAKNQAEEPQISTREQAYKTLTDDIGFGSVSDNVSVIDEKLLIENVTQLKKLNDRFGALTTENNGYFTATSAKNTVAYSQGNFRNLNHQSMSLCGNSYGRGYDYLVSKERDFVSTNWSMPCLDKNLPIYTVTHEYGHIFENKVIRGRVDMDVFEKEFKKKMLDGTSAKKATDFLKKEEAKQAKNIWQEITQIAKEENPDFLVSKNISEYGKTNYFEAFAETFANSQCGAPNELGKAMNIWLERNGY